jgi:hypothetical protein
MHKQKHSLISLFVSSSYLVIYPPEIIVANGPLIRPTHLTKQVTLEMVTLGMLYSHGVVYASWELLR